MFAARMARSSSSNRRTPRGRHWSSAFPVLVQMEKYAGGKRTRVVRILEDEDDWPKPSGAGGRA